MASQSERPLEVGLPAGMPKSLSDRPMAVRWLIKIQRFVVTKPLGAFGVFIIIVFLIAALFADALDRYDPETIFTRVNPDYDPELAEQALEDPSIKLLHPPSKFQKGDVPLSTTGPSADHWLGTDGLGRDLYSRIVHGATTAARVGVGAAVFAVLLGTVVGLASAYFGGLVDFVAQRFVDTFQAFPALIILLLFNQVVANPTVTINTLSLGIIGVASSTRIVRSAVLSTREEVYVSAARVIGASDLRMMFRHIFPNVTAPIIVIFTSSIGLYILAEATLAFLGLGDPTAVSWGKMVEEGRRLGPASPLMALFVGSALAIAVLGFNLAGDALRDVLDPRLRGRGGRATF
jgi:peptide/nickel transport system permease protein